MQPIAALGFASLRDAARRFAPPRAPAIAASPTVVPPLRTPLESYYQQRASGGTTAPPLVAQPPSVQRPDPKGKGKRNRTVLPIQLPSERFLVPVRTAHRLRSCCKMVERVGHMTIRLVHFCFDLTSVAIATCRSRSKSGSEILYKSLMYVLKASLPLMLIRNNAR